MTAAAFLDRYRAIAANLPGDSALRAAAARAFAEAGLPGETRQRRTEAWKYTSLRDMAQATFRAGAAPRHEAETILAGVPPHAGQRAVFADGLFRADLSSAPLARFADRPDFGTLTWPDREPMAALNTMLAADGAVIEIADGTDAGTLQLVHVAASDGDFHPRHTIRLGAGARLTLLEVSVGQGIYLTNTLAEVHVGPGAHLTHVRVQQESLSAFHVSTSYADIAAGGSYDSFTLNLGSALSRTEVRAALSGPGAVAHLNAAQVLAGRQHADFTSVVGHDAPNCQSRQTVASVLAGRSHGVFQGKIEVARHAQKTDGYQMGKALLLSEEAEISTKPELQIFADDVKCSHGSTVGCLDAEQLFYARSRGVPEAEAKAMLVRAFLTEALEHVADATIRDGLGAAVAAWWEGQQAHG